MTKPAARSARRLFSTLSAKLARQREQSLKRDIEATWYTPSKPLSGTSLGRYGLQRVDYRTVLRNPPVWPLPPHPPGKTWADRFVYPLTMAVVVATAVWAYANPEEEDMTEYWKKVESGQILLEDDWDDDDEED